MQASHIVVALIIGTVFVIVGLNGKPGSFLAAIIDPKGLAANSGVNAFGGGAAGSFA